MPWGVRNCYYQTSQSKGADIVGGQSLTPSRYTKRVPSGVRSIGNLCLGEYEIANTRLLGQRARPVAYIEFLKGGAHRKGGAREIFSRYFMKFDIFKTIFWRIWSTSSQN